MLFRSELLQEFNYSIDCLEIWEPYVEKFNLKQKYNNVIIGNIIDFDFTKYDYLILGDILEHLPVIEAQIVIRNINKFNKKCLVSVPFLYEQGEHFGNIYEKHLQADLTPEIMKKRFPSLKFYCGNNKYAYYLNYNLNSKIKIGRRNSKIKIPKNFVSPGEEGLRLESPWLVPKSVFFLDKILKKTDVILEIGLGASSLFFARRCAKAVGIETNLSWLEKLKQHSYNHGLDNIESIYLNDEKYIIKYINTYRDCCFDLISIDSNMGYNRDIFLQTAMSKLKPNGIVLLDNFASKDLFPVTHNMNHIEILNKLNLEKSHIVKDFLHCKWTGKGTRIIYPRIQSS